MNIIFFCADALRRSGGRELAKIGQIGRVRHRCRPKSGRVRPKLVGIAPSLVDLVARKRSTSPQEWSGSPESDRIRPRFGRRRPNVVEIGPEQGGVARRWSNSHQNWSKWSKSPQNRPGSPQSGRFAPEFVEFAREWSKSHQTLFGVARNCRKLPRNWSSSPEIGWNRPRK